jgi:hypothetical protein
MIEITSFNALFQEAARAGLLLQQFHQTPDGRWLASWRRGSGPGATHYPSATHERPFDAMLKAFIVAFGAMAIEPAWSYTSPSVKVDPPLGNADDLFA